MPPWARAAPGSRDSPAGDNLVGTVLLGTALWGQPCGDTLMGTALLGDSLVGIALWVQPCGDSPCGAQPCWGQPCGRCGCFPEAASLAAWLCGAQHSLEQVALEPGAGAARSPGVQQGSHTAWQLLRAGCLGFGEQQGARAVTQFVNSNVHVSFLLLFDIHMRSASTFEIGK